MDIIKSNNGKFLVDGREMTIDELKVYVEDQGLTLLVVGDGESRGVDLSNLREAVSKTGQMLDRGISRQQAAAVAIAALSAMPFHGPVFGGFSGCQKRTIAERSPKPHRKFPVPSRKAR